MHVASWTLTLSSQHDDHTANDPPAPCIHATLAWRDNVIPLGTIHLIVPTWQACPSTCVQASHAVGHPSVTHSIHIVMMQL
jgi:hypothetical protein